MQPCKTYIFIDGEYAFTCSMREGQVPNYNGLLAYFKERYPVNVKSIYFVGAQNKKQGLSDFLIKSGVEFVTNIPMQNCSKTQVLGTTIALDIVKIMRDEDNCDFAFLTGDDYMIPIAGYLSKHGHKSFVHYFPLILSRDLEVLAEYRGINCKLIRMQNFFMYPKGEAL